FQAEDGIRDWSVTGVQTCALPIFLSRQSAAASCGSASMNRLITATKPKPSAFIGTDPVRSCLNELVRFDRCPVSPQRAFELCGVHCSRRHVLSQAAQNRESKSMGKANRIAMGDVSRGCSRIRNGHLAAVNGGFSRAAAGRLPCGADMATFLRTTSDG